MIIILKKESFFCTIDAGILEIMEGKYLSMGSTLALNRILPNLAVHFSDEEVKNELRSAILDNSEIDGVVCRFENSFLEYFDMYISNL